MNDLISRQAAIDALEALTPHADKYVMPEETHGFYAGIAVAERQLQLLPSAQPKQKSGKWKVYVISPFDGEDIRCSECGQCGCAPYWDYCPNCGARMDGEEE